MLIKNITSKTLNFFRLPKAIRRLYIESISDRLNYEKRLADIICYLSRESRVNISSAISRAKESECLSNIIKLYGEISGTPEMWELIFIQSLVFVTKPDIIVETGVAYGATSAMILEAMEFNRRGKLYSIDLPITKTDSKIVPFIKDYKFNVEDITYVTQKHNTGCLVSDHLKYRWHLVFGNTLNELPKLLDELGTIDIFHHDSMHLYEYMMYEFTCAWPKIRNGGYLLSHDIFLRKNTAIMDFAVKNNRKMHNFRNEGIIIK